MSTDPKDPHAGAQTIYVINPWRLTPPGPLPQVVEVRAKLRDYMPTHWYWFNADDGKYTNLLCSGNDPEWGHTPEEAVARYTAHLRTKNGEARVTIARLTAEIAESEAEVLAVEALRGGPIGAAQLDEWAQ